MRFYHGFMFVLALFVFNAHAYEIRGKVIGVADGDTIRVLDENKTQHKIRFADIDAPESGQPFGKRAKRFLSNLVYGKQVRADCREKDGYGRNVCTVFVGQIDTNRALVENGYAWVYKQYNTRDDLPYLEAQAKSARAGLWSAPEAQIINPSDWRKGQRGVQEQVRQAAAKQASAADYTCGSKRYCKQMSSCEEAIFYLKQCGLSRLDGDGNGTPCDSLCRR